MKEYRMPKTVNDLRIRHLKALKNPMYQGEMTPTLVCEFLADLLGIHINEVFKIDVEDVYKMFNHARLIYSDIGIETPPKELTMSGQVYERVDPKKVGVGWHIDFSSGDIEADPVWLACLFYYPKGVKYGLTDENHNLVHPIKDRYKIFENEMSLQTFINASAFFLLKIKKSTTQSMETQKAKRKVIQVLSSLNGKPSSTS